MGQIAERAEIRVMRRGDIDFASVRSRRWNSSMVGVVANMLDYMDARNDRTTRP